ncbi:MAG: proton-conducting transporter membrane subunit [Planctomycetota bacterium]|nr:proton-conducting transporter membrane subunit [Planctomycetota bacterium]
MSETLMILAPELILTATLLAVLLSDAARWRSFAYLLALSGTLCALLASALAPRGTVGDQLAIDAWAALARPAILLSAVLLLMAARSLHDDDDGPAWAALLLALALGALVTAASAHLLPLWLGLELMSLSGYALAGWRAGSRRSAEAGMKYVLFGGAASALSLYGMSHLYGLAGRLDFAGIGAMLAVDQPLPVTAALLIASVGLAYKLTLVPFHYYAPDVYQGAPPLAVASVGTLPKIAAIAVLVRALSSAVPESLVSPASVGGLLALLATASLLVAALTAVVARDAQRIIAYSAIAHAGSMVLALAARPHSSATAAAAFYLAAYVPATIGALLALALLAPTAGRTALVELAGSGQRRPWTGVALVVCLASLAGLPPLAGFLAKWGVLRAALEVGLGAPERSVLLWAAGALLLSTAISAWAYLLIIRAVFFQPAPAQQTTAASPLPPGVAAVLALCVAATLALGLWLSGFAVLLHSLHP